MSKPKKEKIYVIFMRRLGKVYSLRVSASYLIVFFIFLSAYVVISLFLLNNLFDLYSENSTLKASNEKLEKQVNNLQLRSQLASQYHLLIEELNKADEMAINNDQDNSGINEQKTTAKADKQVVASVDSSVSKASKNELEVKNDEEDSNFPVEVSNLNLTANESKKSIAFSFSLLKVNPAIDLVSGYMVVVLENRKTKPVTLAPFPASIQLNDGYPANIRRGQQFAIRHGKTVRGTINNISEPGNFNAATIYAYSFKGEVLLKKSIMVGNTDEQE